MLEVIQNMNPWLRVGLALFCIGLACLVSVSIGYTLRDRKIFTYAPGEVTWKIDHDESFGAKRVIVRFNHDIGYLTLDAENAKKLAEGITQ